MGILVQGSWGAEALAIETDSVGAFQRSERQFRNRITADGTSGFKAEPGRYHLYVAYNCPWAHRVLIFRAVKKLEAAITVAYALPGIREPGWLFACYRQFSECTPDTGNGIRHLHQAYTASDPNYTGKVTVPTLWDTRTRQIVNNESSEIIRMLNSEFRGIAGDATDSYPAHLRPELDRITALVYANGNHALSLPAFPPPPAAHQPASPPPS